MAFACQKNSYLKELTTKVVSCTPAELKQVVNGKKQTLQGYEIITEDTVLFPEGGGQPDDRGTMNGIDVHRVTRRGGDAVLFVETAIEPGTEILQKVDWTRRFDHMQQHSAQHLITAIAEERYGWPTTSWDLGKEKSFIEMDTPKIGVEEMQELEKEVNTAIRKQLAMTPRLVDLGSSVLNSVRTRGLPDDHVGQVRIVEIETIEANTCCGTHVANLSHLQSIKLLGAEKGKKSKTNLYFLAGNRVLDYLGKCLTNEKLLTGFLKCGPDGHPQAAEKIQKSLKVANKSTTMLLRDLAALEAYRYNNQADKDPVLVLHRKEGDLEFLNMIANEINLQNCLALLTAGDEKGAGMFLAAGPDDIIKEVGPKIAECLEGKGASKTGRYQGKANKMSKRSTAEEVLRSYTQKLTAG
ncbi:alanyl-tRNA editing protein Aarsd1-like [Acanthaster planci]|uniref:Alanyl-tRNA editing protein Aarsd1-like n=1 Tax=Acanthaster planci TaxID=133434 RepID=A0A8B7Y1P9_ACAPL|nr:alanyl-tRNA editing protein Aarsd1-like [Acanthaster planci]